LTNWHTYTYAGNVVSTPKVRGDGDVGGLRLEVGGGPGQVEVEVKVEGEVC